MTARDDGPGPVESAARVELAALALDVARDTSAATALALAARLDNVAGPGAAAVARELEAAMERLRARAAAARATANPLDEVRARRETRRAAR